MYCIFNLLIKNFIMDKKLLEKYLNNNCSEEELEIVLNWLINSGSLNECTNLLYSLWNEIHEEDAGSAADFEKILHKIHHEINVRDSKSLMEEADNNLIRYNRKKYLLRIIRNVAAILFLPVLGFGLSMLNKYQSSHNSYVAALGTTNQVFSSADAITKINLPDSSVVWLNHSSSLRYPSVFIGDQRLVELEGEGFFEVSSNPDKPFIVNTGKIQVVAHGTIFNVMAYPEENRVETSLIKGEVDLREIKQLGKTEILYKMNPSDLAVYDKTSNSINTRTIKDDRYFSWKNGKMVLTDEPMTEVIRKISRWFNVDISIGDPRLNDLTLTATFVNETLPEVLELLSHVYPVGYTISDRAAVDDGTFTKRKVFLYYKI